MTPEISVTVPGGKVTAVKLSMSGLALVGLEIPFNGEAVESENENSLYTWSWKNAEGVENVTCTWTNNYYLRYIHSIKVEYTPDLGGKQECGLSFTNTSYEAIIGEKFTSPKLKNPNNLAVSWTSSNESVATVDAQGNVTLVSGGKTTIAATTEGNDEFAKGNAKYELEVIPSASNISELIKMAPALYDRVKVNFPATVTYCNLSTAFVIDSEGNASCFDDIRNRGNQSTSSTNMYKVGQVIPAGWIATNATINESVIWEGIPDKSTETVEVTYPEVQSISRADADRVVTLMNVKFEKNTPEGTSKAYGTTPDGTSYEFQNTYEISGKPAGTYDVTGVVRYSKRGSTEYFYMAPISYAESKESSAELNEAETGKARYYNLQGSEVSEPKSGTFVKVVNGKSTKIIKK
ncbi:MAG: Ig-like domain-containing protein [Muribaculaceae bacterium]|nr:Ig-like domain-containing protein [Muribaculaceae bacterium]